MKIFLKKKIKMTCVLRMICNTNTYIKAELHPKGEALLVCTPTSTVTFGTFWGGIADSPNIPAPVYITEDVLASGLVGLEERLASLITKSSGIGGKKRMRSPSPTLEPQMWGQWADDVESPSEGQEEGKSDDSSSEETISEELFSASQSQKVTLC